MTKKKPKAIKAEVNWRLIGEMESRLRRVEEAVVAMNQQHAEEVRIARQASGDSDFLAHKRITHLGGRVDGMNADFSVQVGQLQRDILGLRDQLANRTLWQRISSLWS